MSPAGTKENSPPIHRWDGDVGRMSPARDGRNQQCSASGNSSGPQSTLGCDPKSRWVPETSSVPGGTLSNSDRFPTNKLVGYFLASLRDCFRVNSDLFYYNTPKKIALFQASGVIGVAFHADHF